MGCARISLDVSEETPVTAQPAQLAAAPPIPGLEAAWILVVVLGLSCSAVCGILVPQPGIKPELPALQGEFLTTEPSGKSLKFIFEEIRS